MCSPGRHAARQPLLISLVALLLASAQLTLPLVHALHVAIEESALARGEHPDCCCDDDDARDESETGQAAAGSAPTHHHHHDESHCATCQLIASIRAHGFALVALNELHLDLSPIPAAVAPIHIWSPDRTADAVARGPPCIV